MAFAIPQVPLAGLGIVPEQETPLSDRARWERGAEAVSRTIADGNWHLACMALSLGFLLWQASRGRSRIRGPVPPIPLAYAAAQMLATAVAFSLSLVVAFQQGPWKEAAALGYLSFLAMARVVVWSGVGRACIYHHLNAVVLFAAVLEAVELLLPLAMIGSHNAPTRIAKAKLSCLAAVVLISFVCPRPAPGKKPKSLEDAEDHNPNPTTTVSPEETCSWFSFYVSYGWITHVILRGFSTDLAMDDLPPLPRYDAPLIHLRRLCSARQAGAKNTMYTLWSVFRDDIRTIVIWSVATGIVEYTAAFAMYNLLGYLEMTDPSSDAVVHPFVWIALLFVGPMVRSVCYQRSIFTSTRLLVKVKAAVIQEVFQKMFRSRIDESLHVLADKNKHRSESPIPEAGCSELPLNLAAPPPTPIKTESLVSYDADAIANVSDLFYALTASIVSTAVAMTFLYQILGWPSLSGIAVLVALTPLPAFFADRLSRLHRSVMEATDARLSKIAEYLSAIRTLKYFAWEAAASDTINQIRLTEQQRIWKRNMTSMLVTMTGEMLSLVSLLAMFSSLVLFTDRPLRTPVAFTALAITETLRSQFVWLSKVAQWVAQGRESLQRVDAFLASGIEKQRHKAGPPAFVDATFRLSAKSSSVFRLHSLNIAFCEKALTVVTGPTGSGKTSLLLSLLGETSLELGRATCPPDVAYVPQTAWLQNSTIRHNILFYSAIDEPRYQAVLAACDLVSDLAQLALGDLTPVGERGSLLSGGQRQRISLARALYSPASTLLLDDVFSALDTHTTSRVYKSCFQSGMLADRTVILATHLPSAVRHASMVVTMSHGTAIVSLGEPDAGSPSEPVDNDNDKLSASSGGCSNSTSTILSEEDAQGTAAADRIDLTFVDSGEFEHQEHRASGRVPRTLIFKYMLLFRGHHAAILAVLGALLVQLAYFSITFWLSIWTGSAAKDNAASSTAKSAVPYLLIYAGTVVAFVSFQVVNTFNYQRGGWYAARTMHRRLVTGVMQAPLSWFDRTPIGSIVNRFGLDMQSIDAVLVDWLRMTIDNGLRFALRLVSIASIMPIFALPAGVFCLIGFATGELYSRAEISVKRLCAVKFSPVFSHFSDGAAGLAVIRGRQRMDDVFQRILADKLAAYMRACEAQYNCNRWVSVRSDFCAATIAATAGCIAYYKSGAAGLVGFSLTNAIGLSQTILMLVRNMNELEVELNSLQRIAEFARIAPEESPTALAHPALPALPASWPASGRVEFRDVTARYAADGPDVLHGVSFAVRPGERVAIVGRTGSGKSTLALSLLRATQIVSGQVVVDGVDVRAVGLERLRTSISLIPQETILFAGDVQSNLDPAGKLEEAELRSILEVCSGSGGTGLDPHAQVTAGGKNFSSGQRQVLGLARAMARRAKVVIMDEATASVDQRTDTRMQKLIRSEFAGTTIITIAHRLRTIVDYDRVVVMGEGRVLEIGAPRDLIKRQGPFWDMLKNSGEYDKLVSLLKAERE